MGVFTYETEFTSVIPPARLFKAFILDVDNLIPKIASNQSLIEGDVLSEHKIEKVSYETRLVESAEGGSIVKSISNYYTIGDIEIQEEHVKAGKEKASQLFKLVEGYLLANPDAYN
ncbi:hypothetical protein ACLB2K_039922 [Fragaria x ananassa]